MSLSTVELQALSRLLEQALELPVPGREAWFAALPDADAALAPRLRALLKQQTRLTADRYLETLPSLGPQAWRGKPGQRIGPYQLSERLGRGGMGEVWRAARADGAFERDVALKLPRVRLGQDLAARLQFECQVAARLEHPHIARLYDAGVDAEHGPYVASEWVRGKPLDEVAKTLTTREKLLLLVQVTRAVAYAHSRMVLHRDLKPVKVLVDEAGQPHLLDFGIAALLDAPSPDGPRALTPGYAAPEQLAGAPDGVQADVYSLGVTTYEVLTGARPAGRPTDPNWCAPSQMPGVVLRKLRADLDAVVSKAMAEDPAQRYESASQFADELERCLRGDPVLARPLGVLARSTRALRRHWVAGSALGSVLAALAGGGSVSLMHSQRAAQAAERERVVRSFAAELFRFPPATTSLAPSPLLEQGAQLIAERFAGDKVLQAELYAAVGQAYSDMGAHRLALVHRELQIDSLKAVPDGAAARAARLAAQVDLAEVHLQLGEPELALAALQPKQELQAKAMKTLRTDLIAARAAVDLGRFDEATKAVQSLQQQLQGQGPSLEQAWLRATQAEIDARNGQLERAFEGWDAAAPIARQVEGLDSLQAALIVLRGVTPAGQAERRQLAERWVAEAARVLRAKGGAHQVRAVMEELRMWRALAMTLRPVGREEALQGLRSGLAQLRAQGPSVPALLLAEAEGRLGEVQFDFGDLDGAALIEAHYPMRRAALRRPMDAVALHGVAAAAAAEVGQYELALTRSRARHQARLDAGRGLHTNVAVDLRQQALIYAMAGQTEAALAALDRAPAAEQVAVVSGLEPPWYENILREARARVLLDASRPAQALSLIPDRAPHPQDFVLVGLMTTPAALRGEALCQLGRPVQGWPLLREHLDRLSPNRHPNAANVARLRAVAALCAWQAGQHAAAQGLAEEARATFTAQPRVADYFKAPLRAFDSKR